MFTQIQDTVHIFFPIHHVKMDSHLKINTESVTLYVVNSAYVVPAVA